MKKYAHSKLLARIETEPNAFISMPLPKQVEVKISHWEAEGRRCGVFPVRGDSMTYPGKDSIPDGSKVLAVEVDLRGKYCIASNRVPTKKPLLLVVSMQGKQYPICKTIHTIDLVFSKYRLRSYNPKYNDFWIPINSVFAIWEIVHVVKPDRYGKALVQIRN